MATSWIPAIENLGHMKSFLSEHSLVTNDRLAVQGSLDAVSFQKKTEELESSLAKATEIYAATLLTYSDASSAQGNA